MQMTAWILVQSTDMSIMEMQQMPVEVLERKV